MRTCAKCNVAFMARKHGCCPSCGVELYLPGAQTDIGKKGLTLLNEERAAAQKLIELLEKFISKRDGTSFLFDAIDKREQLRCAYWIVVRSRAFLQAQKKPLPGLTSSNFALELFDFILKDLWWAENIGSLRQLNGKGAALTYKANELYRIKRRTIMATVSARQTFTDFAAIYAGASNE